MCSMLTDTRWKVVNDKLWGPRSRESEDSDREAGWRHMA